MSRLMLFGSLSCVLFGSSVSARADEAEDKAAALVEKLGGTVARDEKWPGKPVIRVELIFTKVADADLKELAPLQNLTSLNLSGTAVTGTGLKELAALKNLTTLHLNLTK